MLLGLGLVLLHYIGSLVAEVVVVPTLAIMLVLEVAVLVVHMQVQEMVEIIPDLYLLKTLLRTLVLVVEELLKPLLEMAVPVLS